MRGHCRAGCRACPPSARSAARARRPVQALSPPFPPAPAAPPAAGSDQVQPAPRRLVPRGRTLLSPRLPAPARGCATSARPAPAALLACNLLLGALWMCCLMKGTLWTCWNIPLHGCPHLAAGKTMADIPKDTLEDACQLVKANSIMVGFCSVGPRCGCFIRGCCGASRWAASGAAAQRVRVWGSFHLQRELRLAGAG